MLRAASYADTIDFFCFICEIPHKAPACPFKSLCPRLRIAGGDPLPGLKVVGLSDAQAVDSMEHTSQCVVTLLKSGLNSEGLIGGFFIECLNHLNTTISSQSDTNSGLDHDRGSYSDTNSGLDHNKGSQSDTNSRLDHDGLDHNKGSQSDTISILDHGSAASSSSVLLACEDNLPLTSGEVSSSASLLHITAALCEYLGQEVIAQSHLPSLLAACGGIVECHAQVLQRADSGIRLTVKREESVYEEMVMGGPLSLSIVLGLLSAVMAGAVSSEEGGRVMIDPKWPHYALNDHARLSA